MSNPNMRIWDVLGKTDPSATKTFKRAGGFSGTAIRPMWANMRMTQQFGPAGIGWGQTEPKFETITTNEEILVYCTVGLWYIEGDEKRGPVYGVGGDKVLTQIFEKDNKGNKIKDEATGRFKTHPQTDDEAYKKAYTDALGNAMKFVGVGADVHMGQFDDSKYVQSMREEFAGDDKKEAEVRAEVDRQRAAAKQMTLSKAVSYPTLDVSEAHFDDAPPELEWSYNKASGVLICKILEAKVMSTKDKKKEFLVIQINGKIEGSSKDKLYYWHASNFRTLLDSVGKVSKFMVEPKGDFPNIIDILEVGGIKVQKEGVSVETMARLLASTLEFTEEELMETHTKICKGSWELTLTGLQNEKKRREAVVE